MHPTRFFTAASLALLCLAAPAQALVMRKFATEEGSQLRYGLYAELVWGPDSSGPGGGISFLEPIIDPNGWEDWSWFGGYFSAADAGGLLYIEAADGDKDTKYGPPFTVESLLPVSLYQPFGRSSYLAFDTGVWGSLRTLCLSPLPDTEWGCIVSDTFHTQPLPIRTPDGGSTAGMLGLAIGTIALQHHLRTRRLIHGTTSTRRPTCRGM